MRNLRKPSGDIGYSSFALVANARDLHIGQITGQTRLVLEAHCGPRPQIPRVFRAVLF
jgi:hypothetical protein